MHGALLPTHSLGRLLGRRLRPSSLNMERYTPSLCSSKINKYVIGFGVLE
jgi:hypothetical protein